MVTVKSTDSKHISETSHEREMLACSFVFPVPYKILRNDMLYLCMRGSLVVMHIIICFCGCASPGDAPKSRSKANSIRIQGSVWTRLLSHYTLGRDTLIYYYLTTTANKTHNNKQVYISLHPSLAYIIHSWFGMLLYRKRNWWTVT